MSAAVPGLETVRVPERVSAGVHLALSALAGFGVAGVLRSFPAEPRWWRPGAALLVGVMTLAMITAPRGSTLFASCPTRTDVPVS